MALAEGTPSAPQSGSYPIPVTYTGTAEDDNRQPVLPVKIWPTAPIVLHPASDELRRRSAATAHPAAASGHEARRHHRMLARRSQRRRARRHAVARVRTLDLTHPARRRHP